MSNIRANEAEGCDGMDPVQDASFLSTFSRIPRFYLHDACKRCDRYTGKPRAHLISGLRATGGRADRIPITGQAGWIALIERSCVSAAGRVKQVRILLRYLINEHVKTPGKIVGMLLAKCRHGKESRISV